MKKRPKYEWPAENKFSTSYRDISVIVGENNSIVKPKYQQYTSLLFSSDTRNSTRSSHIRAQGYIHARAKHS